MKKYIQGRKFDTSTAKQVWTKNNGFGVNLCDGGVMIVWGLSRIVASSVCGSRGRDL